MGYFVPGLRHINGYLSGITRMGLLKYALYAYTGAFLWCTTFLLLGYEFQGEWFLLENYIRRHSSLRMPAAILIIASAAVIYSGYKKKTTEKSFC